MLRQEEVEDTAQLLIKSSQPASPKSITTHTAYATKMRNKQINNKNERKKLVWLWKVALYLTMTSPNKLQTSGHQNEIEKRKKKSDRTHFDLQNNVEMITTASCLPPLRTVVICINNNQ